MARTILLADDSVTIQKVVELTFMDGDYQVVSVGDGGAALERLAAVRPDLLIVDVHMPGASGYEVCRRAKVERPAMPVLLLVGTFEAFDEAEAKASGADGFIKKPFEAEDLLRQVESLVAAAGPAAPATQPPPANPAPVSDTASTRPTAARLATEARAAAPASASPAAAAPPAAESAPAAPSANGRLGDEDVDRIARRVAQLLGEKTVRDVAWEVVPDLAEVIIRERIRELEGQVE